MVKTGMQPHPKKWMSKDVYSLDEIRKIAVPIARKYNLASLYVFGSYARGTATASSDIDFLVDTTGTKLTTLFKLGELYVELEAAFNKQIDLITVSSFVQPVQFQSELTFRKTVWKEKVNIYDAA